jgi:nucleoside-diphosphate-sugar epimerase
LSTGNFNKHHILVTGASGFLGRKLVPELLRHGAHVLGVDQSAWPGDTGATPKGIENYRHLQADLAGDLDPLADFLSQVPRSRRGVFHLAGLADAGNCKEFPDAAFKANVALTFRLLDLCRRVGGAKFIFPSTGLVYGDGLMRAATENDPVYPHSVYASTKIAAEALVRAYAVNYGCSAVIARLSNVYGPGIGENTVIGRILAQVSRGERIQVHDEHPVRDFIYIEDVVHALVALYPVELRPDDIIVNISTGEGTRIGEVVRSADHAFCGQHGRLRPTSGNTSSHLVLANDKLKKLTRWAPSTGIGDGLARSIMRQND